MQEDQRIILTRDKIQKELKEENKGAFFLLLISISVFALADYLLILVFRDIAWLKVIIHITLAFFIICCLYIFVRYTIIFKTGEFGVIEDKVTNIISNALDKKSLFNSSHINPILKEKVTFERMGIHMFNKQDLGHLSVGDTVILVIIKPFKRNIVLKLYNSREYSLNKYNYVGIKKQ